MMTVPSVNHNVPAGVVMWVDRNGVDWASIARAIVVVIVPPPGAVAESTALVAVVVLQ